MIKKIRIENLMSHEDTVIEPASGITLICGANNIGKSVISIALYFLSAAKKYQSKVGKDWMIRHGQKQATVTVELENDDGLHEIQWRRKKNSEGWTVDGVDSDRGSPPELDEILKLTNENFGKESMQVHLSEQKEPLFILKESGAVIAECLASTNDTKYILKMQSVHKKNIKEAKNQKKYSENDCKEKEEELDRLSSVDDIIPLVENAEDLDKKIQSNRDSIKKINGLLDGNKNISRGLEINSNLIDQLLDLSPPPDLEEIKDLSNLLKDLKQTENERLSAQSSLGKLEPLKSPPDLLKTETLQTLISKCSTLINELKSHSDEKKEVDAAELELQNEYKEYVKNNPQCPTCGEVLKEDFMDHMSKHG